MKGPPRETWRLFVAEDQKPAMMHSQHTTEAPARRAFDNQVILALAAPTGTRTVTLVDPFGLRVGYFMSGRC